MKYYLIAGEASGDLHGANLMQALQAEDINAQFRFWGGDKMQQVGGTLVMHYRDIAFMGFLEVLRNIRAVLGNLNFCKKDLLKFDPDFIIFIDYPGFNIRILKWAKKSGLAARRIYYISPQVWAWKADRAHKLREALDQMFVILPFEKAFYRRYQFEVSYVGHPLLDHLEKLKYPVSLQEKYGLSAKPIIALLPGSRQQEIGTLLSVMVEMVPLFADFQFVIAAVSSVSEKAYDLARNIDRVTIIPEDTNLVLHSASAALVASGTATLEAALMRVPLVVCYRGGAVNYQIAKRLINVKYISLVNLILDKMLVLELIQHDLTKTSLQEGLKYILSEQGRRALSQGYAELIDKLGGPGASAKVAHAILHPD